MTLIPPVHLSGEDLKHLIRYEVSFSDLTKSETPFSNYVLDGDYNTTVEDLKTAVINLREKNANFENYSHDWFENIYYDKSLTDALHIPPYEYNDDGFGKYRKEILPVREDIVKRDVFEMIGEFTEDYEMLCDDNFQKKFPFDEILRKITYFTAEMIFIRAIGIFQRIVLLSCSIKQEMNLRPTAWGIFIITEDATAESLNMKKRISTFPTGRLTVYMNPSTKSEICLPKDTAFRRCLKRHSGFIMKCISTI